MPENFILSLTQSDERDVKNLGIQKILEICGAAPFKRIKKINKVKTPSKRWSELINLKTEPPLALMIFRFVWRLGKNWKW